MHVLYNTLIYILLIQKSSINNFCLIKKILFHFSDSINLKVISWKSYSLDIPFFKFTYLFLNSRKISQALFKHHGIFALKDNLKPLALGRYQQRL